MPDTPDKFDQHEALHTAYILHENWERFVSLSTYAHARPDVQAKCEAALVAMAEAYQAIGQEDME